MSGTLDLTPNLNLIKPDVLGDEDVWGDHLNQNADILDDQIAARVERSGDQMIGPLTLARDPVSDFEAATKGYVDALVSVGGAEISPTPPRGVQGDLWWDSTGGQLYVWYDDGDSLQWVIANSMTMAGGPFLPISGGALTGPLVLAGPPTLAAQAANMSYVDTQSVSTFNTRKGVVTLAAADITSAGGALLASPVFTGTPSLPTGATAFTQAPGDNDTSIATTAFVTNATASVIAGFAPLASPVFTGNPTAPTPAPGDADTSLATTAFVAAAVAPVANNVGRNLIHNSLFNVAQRGQGGFAAQGYTLDRWYQFIGLDTVAVSQGSLSDANRAAIGDEAATWCYYNTFTGNAGAASYNFAMQRVEDVRRLAGKTITVSFYAQSNAGTPKLGISIDQVFGTGGSPSATVSGNGVAVTIGTTFARYSATFAVPSASGKVLGTNNDHSTALNLWFSSGTTQAARAGGIGVQSGSIAIWGVQLEIGSAATPLEKPGPQQDLAKCQRFYQSGGAFLAGMAASPFGLRVAFPVLMRSSSPTLTITPTANVNMGALTIAPDGYDGAIVYGNATGAGVATQIRATYTASADL